MRATLPMSSLLRQGSNLRKSKSNSPTLSPTSAWKTVISPDASLSGQRSPGSLSYKGTGISFQFWNNALFYDYNAPVSFGQNVFTENLHLIVF